MDQQSCISLRVLLIDDDEDEFILLHSMLKDRVYLSSQGERMEMRLDWAADFSQALAAFERAEYDAYLVDIYLGGRDGLDLLTEAVKRQVAAPLIVLTGDESYESEVEAAATGAADFLVKPFVNGLLLERSIRYAIERKRTEVELTRAHAELEERVRDRTRDLQETNLALQAEIQERRRVQEELQAIKDDLEIQVLERTGELQQANERLTQTNVYLKTILGQLESERARLSAIIANAPGALVLADQDGQILMANPAAHRLFGPLGSNQPVEEKFSKIFCSDGTIYDAVDLPLSRSALRGEVQTNQELILETIGHDRQHILVNSAPILDSSGNISGAIALFQDITAKRKSEEERRQHLTQLEVQRRIYQHREMERLQIARELHDGPIQDLLAIGYAVSDVHHRTANLPTSNPEELAVIHARLADVHAALKSQVQKLRTFMSELRPPVLANFGLEKAIRSHTHDFLEKNPEMVISLDLAVDNNDISEAVRVSLFRIYQETLNNALRHSETRQVFVRLRLESEQVTLLVQDFGRGFEVPDDWLGVARRGHFGLVGVMERATSVGGVAEIHSAPGEGTRVEVTAPLHSQVLSELNSVYETTF